MCKSYYRIISSKHLNLFLLVDKDKNLHYMFDKFFIF